MIKKINNLFLITGLIVLFGGYTYAQQSSLTSSIPKDSITSALIHMSLEELMKVTIKTGTFTGIKKQNSPVSITTITSEDIRHSPARNLLDLLDTYVPEHCG